MKKYDIIQEENVVVKKENLKMVPKIFISSTFYDLKYARDNIGEFVEEIGFKAIRFETGNVGYIPYETLDASCYEAMKTSDMAILVIGGRYGSAASDEDNDEKFKHYKSVTRKEFDTAVKSKVPVYVFIEAPVFHEYNTYIRNKDNIENGTISLNYCSVDNVNVFRFIEEIYTIPGIPVWPFNHISEISETLKQQWASLFLRYLMLQKNGAKIKKVEEPLYSIETSINEMKVLINKLGDKIIGGVATNLENVKVQQEIENLALAVAASFDFYCIKRIDVKVFVSFLIDKLLDEKSELALKNGLSESAEDLLAFQSYFNYDGVMISDYNDCILFSLDDLKKNKASKEKIIDRLLEKDCLIKMHLA